MTAGFGEWQGGDGILRPGHSPGTAGIPDLTGLIGIEIEIAGPAAGQYDIVILDGGVATFPEGFKIKFILLGDYIPANGADFEFLFADKLEGAYNILYSFLKPDSTILPNGFSYQVYVDGDADLHVRFFDTDSPLQDYVYDLYTGAVVVPEPSTTALGLLGLALLRWRMRRPVAIGKH
jgi:PEP-CTERM motif